jgi:hypothetical protein
VLETVLAGWRLRPLRRLFAGGKDVESAPLLNDMLWGEDRAFRAAVPRCAGEVRLEKTPLMLGYIDPGSGTILVQLLIGSVIGAGLFFRTTIGRLLRVLRRN